MGETIYSEEDDLHHPTLTVGQTLDFALSLKTPGKLLPSQTKAQFKEMALDTMLKMLNIQRKWAFLGTSLRNRELTRLFPLTRTHSLDTRNTLVGNAFVRGVSGGERKRVSIAEAMTTRGAVLSWDNSTRGL